MQSLDQFEAYRPLMFSIAYRMLGSAMEAEDMVQEAYLRYQSVNPETIRSPKAFLNCSGLSFINLKPASFVLLVN